MILAQLSLVLVALCLVDQSSAQFWKNDKIVKQWQAATTGNDGAAVADKSNGMNSLASSYMNAFVPAAINSGLGSLIGSYQDTSKDSSAVASSGVAGAASSAKDDYSKTYQAPSSAAATYEHAPSLKQPQPQPNYAPAYPSYDNYNKYPASSYEYKQPSYGSHESYSKPSYGYESSHEYKQPSYGSHESYSKPSYGSHEYKQPEYKQPEYKQPEYKQPEYKQPEYPSKPSYGSHEYKQPEYKQPEYPSKPSYGSHESYNKPSYGSHDSYQAVLPPSILPQGAYPIHQPTITNTGETIIENLVGGIPFDCRGRSTGHWRDNKYCDIFHACVFGIQRKTYVCPYVGERTYFDETTRRCEFVYRNPHGCGSNNYYH